jgi:hypothetical protein
MGEAARGIDRLYIAFVGRPVGIYSFDLKKGSGRELTIQILVLPPQKQDRARSKLEVVQC